MIPPFPLCFWNIYLCVYVLFYFSIYFSIYLFVYLFFSFLFIYFFTESFGAGRLVAWLRVGQAGQVF